MNLISLIQFTYQDATGKEMSLEDAESVLKDFEVSTPT